MCLLAITRAVLGHGRTLNGFVHKTKVTSLRMTEEAWFLGPRNLLFGAYMYLVFPKT